jgi:hypothetical protein
MAIINIIGSSGISIVNEGETDYATNLIRTENGGITYINEDITKQVVAGKSDYRTTYTFLASSLEVFVNGMKVSHEFDFTENASKNGFDFITYGGNFNRWLHGTSVVMAKYIKSS